MKRILYILSVVTLPLVAGQNQPSKKVEVENGKSSKYTFEGIEIENKASVAYKTLEIRYKKINDPTAKEVTINGEQFKCFSDKRSAVSYYNIVKQNADKEVVYYVHSFETKSPEVFTFRISQ